MLRIHIAILHEKKESKKKKDLNVIFILKLFSISLIVLVFTYVTSEPCLMSTPLIADVKHWKLVNDNWYNAVCIIILSPARYSIHR